MISKEEFIKRCGNNFECIDCGFSVDCKLSGAVFQRNDPIYGVESIYINLSKYWRKRKLKKLLEK